VKFTASHIAEVTEGSLEGPDVETDGATQDSRAVQVGQLFIPLVAERDGHDFIGSALMAGASAYLTHRESVGGTAIVVTDTAQAMNKLAQHARSAIVGPVVGVTGSVGKTSTKDLLVGVLRRVMSTHASVKSFNNEIGVPLTLVNAPDGTRAAIVEMGSRGIGHVAALCEIAAPTIGVVTTVAAAHKGEFGSLDAIGVAKGELVEALPVDGLAVLNADDQRVSAMASRTDAAVITFGESMSSDIRISSITLDDELRATFELDSHWGRVVAHPTVRGAHMATNVAAAVGTALWLGLPIADVEAGLADAPVSPWRMEVSHSSSGALIINDSYNANPTSMRGALDSLARLQQLRKVAVVGYMGELGSDEAEDHLGIASEIAAIGAEMVAVGTNLYGVEAVDDPLEAIGDLDKDTAVLVKGSRSAGLESIAKQLLAR